MQAVREDALNGSHAVDRAARREHRLALVVWRDAWFDLDLASPQDARPDYLVRTVGFLLSRGPSVVSLAQELLPDGEGFRAVTHIPVAMVEQVTSLETREALVTP